MVSLVEEVTGGGVLGVLDDSKGGAGGFDTAGMSRAAQQATELQQEIYERTREDIQPWYQTGVASTNKMNALLGLGGDRESVYQGMLAGFTTPGAAEGDP